MKLRAAVFLERPSVQRPWSWRGRRRPAWRQLDEFTLSRCRSL